MPYNRQNKNDKPRELKKCFYCTNPQVSVDYKDIQNLRKFVSSYLKIAPRRRSGLCAFHQRKAANAIKQARIAGLMGFVSK